MMMMILHANASARSIEQMSRERWFIYYCIRLHDLLDLFLLVDLAPLDVLPVDCKAVCMWIFMVTAKFCMFVLNY
jgi:hypothetical protein